MARYRGSSGRIRELSWQPARKWGFGPTQKKMDSASNLNMGFPNGEVIKNPSADAGDIRDVGLIPEWGRFPGGGHGNPLQYSCLENPMDRGVWQATAYEVAQSKAWLKWLSKHSTTWISLQVGSSPEHSERNPAGRPAPTISLKETLSRWGPWDALCHSSGIARR